MFIKLVPKSSEKPLYVHTVKLVVPVVTNHSHKGKGLTSITLSANDNYLNVCLSYTRECINSSSRGGRSIFEELRAVIVVLSLSGNRTTAEEVSALIIVLSYSMRQLSHCKRPCQIPSLIYNTTMLSIHTPLRQNVQRLQGKQISTWDA